MIHTVKDYEKLSEQYNKILEERNSLIDDLPWYKAKVSRLEENNEKLKEELLQSDYVKASIFSDREEYKKQIIKLKEELKTMEQHISKLVSENTKLQNELFSEQLIQDEADDKIKKLERENEKYDKQFTDYIDETNVSLNLLSEISQHIGNKPSSSTYKYFRAKLDNLNITEDK